MNIDWIKKEISKKKDIDWLGIMNTAKLLYKEENDKKSVLGLSKGFINFVKTGWSADDIIKEVKKIYNPDDIVVVNARYSAKFNKILKEGKEITTEIINSKFVIVTTDKNTIETLFNKHSFPYLKFHTNRSSEHYKDESGKTCYKKTFKWRKEGEKGIKWEEGKLVSLKRENLLQELFENGN